MPLKILLYDWGQNKSTSTYPLDHYMITFWKLSIHFNINNTVESQNNFGEIIPISNLTNPNSPEPSTWMAPCFKQLSSISNKAKTNLRQQRPKTTGHKSLITVIIYCTLSHLDMERSFSNFTYSLWSWIEVTIFQTRSSSRPINTMPPITPSTSAVNETKLKF